MARKMPKQKPGKSESVVVTPPEFMAAAKRLLGIEEFEVDLAASDDNAQASFHYTEEQNSLVQSWSKVYVRLVKKYPQAWFWLNPPYDNIRPWLEKCWHESRKGTRIAVLVPASVGSNWWRDFVHEKARVKFINGGRIQFVGHEQGYPKDLVLLLYGGTVDDRIDRKWYTVWNWKQQLEEGK